MRDNMPEQHPIEAAFNEMMSDRSVPFEVEGPMPRMTRKLAFKTAVLVYSKLRRGWGMYLTFEKTPE